MNVVLYFFCNKKSTILYAFILFIGMFSITIVPLSSICSSPNIIVLIFAPILCKPSSIIISNFLFPHFSYKSLNVSYFN